MDPKILSSVHTDMVENDFFDITESPEYLELINLINQAMEKSNELNVPMCTFLIPTLAPDGVHIMQTVKPRFVQVEGGAYAWMPSTMLSLNMLVALPVNVQESISLLIRTLFNDFVYNNLSRTESVDAGQNHEN